MIFISAGHHLKDSGAIGNGTQENKEMISFRDLVCQRLDEKGVKYIKDNDTETLNEYFDRIKTGEGSVVVEFHLDSSENKSATGTTALVGNDARSNDIRLAKDLVNETAYTLWIKNRGVKTEAESHRGRLRIMREAGAVCLLEICFLSNPEDMKNYNKWKGSLAARIADVLEKHENLA